MQRRKRTVCTEPDEALSLLQESETDLNAILDVANRIRQELFGRHISMCSIVNAQCGWCSEDCRFCAQSIHNRTYIDEYPLLGCDQIQAAHRDSASKGVERFSIVTGGRSIGETGLRIICDTVSTCAEKHPYWCASLGILDEEQLLRLRKAGVKRYHHNLESCKSFFPVICTSHTHNERVATIRAARRAGLEICSGGIIGMGEEPAHRVELAFELRDLGVESIALNFLVRVPGTPLYGDVNQLTTTEMIRAIAMFRLVCPQAEIRICAGRSGLGNMENMIFAAGATGIMTGSLLTTGGSAFEHDRELVICSGMKS